jgi:hypothetical protein
LGDAQDRVAVIVHEGQKQGPAAEHAVYRVRSKDTTLKRRRREASVGGTVRAGP